MWLKNGVTGRTAVEKNGGTMLNQHAIMDAISDPSTATVPGQRSNVDANLRRRRVSRVRPRGMGLAAALSLAPALLLFVIFFIIPIGVVAVTAFANWSDAGLSWVGTQNFVTLFHDDVFWRSIRNTLVYCFVSVCIQVPLGVLAGILLTQHLPGWRVIRAVLFIPVVISGAAYAMIYSSFYDPEYGLLNRTLGLLGLGHSVDWLYNLGTALPAVAGTYVFIIGFVMILVMGEIAQIPEQINEAAEVDGASWLQCQRYITLPSLRHIVGTCVLLNLLSTIKIFDVIYIMTDGGPADHTASLGTYAYGQYLNGQWGYANAAAVVTIAVGLLSIVAVRRAFRIGEEG
jgi:raffinose/stachyose/melibiose transport system permease protein